MNNRVYSLESGQKIDDQKKEFSLRARVVKKVHIMAISDRGRFLEYSTKYNYIGTVILYFIKLQKNHDLCI